MKQLEKYYNEQFKQKGDPEFKELSEDDKKSIENTLVFYGCQLDMAFRGLGKQFKKVIINISKQLKKK